VGVIEVKMQLKSLEMGMALQNGKHLLDYDGAEARCS
jgi:hypothetical protein